MEENKRNHGCPNNCSRDGTDQKCFGYCGGIKLRARSNRHRSHGSKRSLPSSTIISPIITPPSAALDVSSTPAPNDNNESNGLKSGLVITGVVIGTLTLLTIIVYCLFRLIKKSKDSQEEEGLPKPRDLTLTFVKHNHPIPELCTTPDTQPIIDYYSSKAGLTIASSFPVADPDDSNVQNPVGMNENPEENINHEYVPQYYNGIEIPPLGARIIPLERQIQIAKESANLSPTNHKRKSNRSISSLLSITSRRKSSATINTTSNNNNNNSTTTLALIRETPRNENIVS